MRGRATCLRGNIRYYPFFYVVSPFLRGPGQPYPPRSTYLRLLARPEARVRRRHGCRQQRQHRRLGVLTRALDLTRELSCSLSRDLGLALPPLVVLHRRGRPLLEWCTAVGAGAGRAWATRSQWTLLLLLVHSVSLLFLFVLLLLLLLLLLLHKQSLGFFFVLRQVCR